MDRAGALRGLYQEKKLDEARKLYEEQPGCSDPEWYWLGSLVYWHLEEYPRSRWAAGHGLNLGPQGEIRMKLLYRLGTTESTLGAYGEAIEHLRECLGALPAYPSMLAIMQGAVLYNLALACYNRNGNPESIRQAISYYQRAAEEFRREGMRNHLIGCLHNLAWALCDVGETHQAADVLDEAAPLCVTEQPRQQQTVVNAYQLLMAGQSVRSLSMLQPLVEGHKEGDIHVFALCVTAMAALQLQGRDPQALANAQAVLRQAILAALRPGANPQCWTTANRVQKRVIAAMQEQSRGA